MDHRSNKLARATITSAYILTDNFPEEMLTSIFCLLPYPDIASLRLTCRRFNDVLVGQNWVWRSRVDFVLAEAHRLTEELLRAHGIVMPYNLYAACTTCAKVLRTIVHFSDGCKDTCLKCRARIMREEGGYIPLKVHGEWCVYDEELEEWITENEGKIVGRVMFKKDKEAEFPGLGESLGTFARWIYPGLSGNTALKCPDCGNATSSDATCWEGVEGCVNRCNCHSHCHQPYAPGCHIIDTGVYRHRHCDFIDCDGILEATSVDTLNQDGKLEGDMFCSSTECHRNELGGWNEFAEELGLKQRATGPKESRWSFSSFLRQSEPNT